MMAVMIMIHYKSNYCMMIFVAVMLTRVTCIRNKSSALPLLTPTGPSASIDQNNPATVAYRVLILVYAPFTKSARSAPGN